MRWLIAVLILSSSLAFAADRKACTAKELKRQDCRLSMGTHKVRLNASTIARDDGVWHVVDEMPLKGEGLTWERIRFDSLGGRSILQLWIWDAGAGEAQVQSLRWYVAEIGKRKMKILAEGIVRRRRVKSPKPEYIYDAWEKHDLKASKDGALLWTLGSQSKYLEGESHGI